ncbi:MAG: HAD family phosphatase [Oscillospiraceae bacterium]|nr:HAD family phosphatase [Oscillospiraceae bacterium]
MIKLIASDMDGTLLDDKKQLPPDFYEVIDRLDEKGIKFVVSSGRTYAAVGHLFPEEYRTRLDYICDNGAYIMHGGKPIHITPLDRATFEEFVQAAERIGGLKLLVCAEGGTYHLPDSEDFNREVAKFYKNHIECDDLLSIKDTIYKLAVCDMQGAQERGKPALDAIFGDRLNIQVSGVIWMDVMAGGISKGSALKKMCELLGIDKSEVMAFGDYYNDTDMLLNAGMSFAMENGNDYIKSICTHRAESNNSGGVTKAIKQYALGEVTV